MDGPAIISDIVGEPSNKQKGTGKDVQKQSSQGESWLEDGFLDDFQSFRSVDKILVIL